MNTKKDIANHFSEGKFSFCYEHFADAIEWQLVGSEPVKGRDNVVSFCEKMTGEMAGSKLDNSNIVEGTDHIVIEGACNYTDAENNPAKVFYCDVYRFEGEKIASITSYCIDKKL